MWECVAHVKAHSNPFSARTGFHCGLPSSGGLRRKQQFEDKMREKAVKKARREEEKGQRRQREQEKEDVNQEMPHERLSRRHPAAP